MTERHSLEFRLSPHEIFFFKGAEGSSLASPMEFLESCPAEVRLKVSRRLIAIASAPPWKFRGGGYWEAMRGDLLGIFELRVDGPGREHFRLFCVLDHFAPGNKPPLLVVLAGARKPFRSTIPDSTYREVLRLREAYLISPERAVE
jgi:hypothetical protein